MGEIPWQRLSGRAPLAPRCGTMKFVDVSIMGVDVLMMDVAGETVGAGRISVRKVDSEVADVYGVERERKRARRGVVVGCIVVGDDGCMGVMGVQVE